MISTSEIVILVALALVLALVIFYFVVAYKYGQTLNVFAYTRGANLDTASTNGKGTVELKCDSARTICVEQATLICTGAENALSNTEAGPEPIANGSNSKVPYGNFDPNTTVDLTTELSKFNGMQNATFEFDGLEIFKNHNQKTCSTFNYKPDGSGTRPQLIATYTCVPKGTSCKGSSTCTSGPCQTKPCQNGGTCTSKNNICTCTCINGYSGDNCEISPTCTSGPCQNKPCQNGGTCTSKNGVCICTCINGYSGTNCEIPPPTCTSGPCQNSPCQNGGTCTSKNGVCTCICANGYSGNNCEIPPNNNTFFTVKGPPGVIFSDVGTNNKGQMCGLSGNNIPSNVWCTDNYLTENPVWTQFTGGQLSNISVTDTNLVCGSGINNVPYCSTITPNNPSWKSYAGITSYMSAGSNGDFCSVNQNMTGNNLWCQTQDNSIHMGVNASIPPTNIVTNNNKTFCAINKKSSYLLCGNTDWKNISGYTAPQNVSSFNDVALNDQNTVCLASVSGPIYCSGSIGGGWKSLPNSSTFKTLNLNNNYICGISDKNDISCMKL
jgi:hypothetical protein